jgi:hypothetical protein
MGVDGQNQEYDHRSSIDDGRYSRDRYLQKEQARQANLLYVQADDLPESVNDPLSMMTE